MKIRHPLKTASAVLCLTIALLIGSVHATVIDKIVAIVNSDIITLVELDREAAPFLKRLEMSGYTPEKKEELAGQIRQDMLNLLIDRSLTQQEAQRFNITVSESEIDEAVETFMSSKGLTREALEKGLERDGITMAVYRENYRKQILQARLINHAVKSKVVITDADIKTYYEANAEAFEGTRKYHLRNILNRDAELMSEIHQKLTQHTRFTLLAKKHSKAPNASDGGDLGMFDISNFSEDIKKEISGLEKGEFTKVIATSQGFQIFYIEDVTIEGQKTLEQAHDEIYDRLYREEVETKFKTWLESLKKQAHIELKL